VGEGISELRIGNPSFATVFTVLKSLDLDLHVSAKRAA
jgi:DNA-binding phage protein